MRWPASAPPARSPTTRSPSLLPTSGRRADRARLRARRSRWRCAAGAPAATASTRSSRRARTARSPTPARATRRIERGELVVIDFGCVVDGYCSDMTRTVSVGDPGPRGAPASGTSCGRASGPGAKPCGPGAECAAVDRACRDVIVAAGWGDAFVHGTGHGVGLEIHEAPRVAATSRGTLAPGDVVTVEPGVYLPGVGGVRIEDTCRRHPRRRRPPHRVPEGSGPVSAPLVSISTNDLKNGMALNLPLRGPGDRRRVPARQAGQGRRLRAHEAQEGAGPVRCSSARSGPTRRSRSRSSTSGRCSTSTARAPRYVFMDTETYDQLPVETARPRRARSTT